MKAKFLLHIMMSFKDLKVWQKSSLFTKDIYSVTNQFPSEKIYGLTNQIRSAVNSISSNIAEGFARLHKKEKQQFYSIAYGSAVESESQIEIAYALSFLNKKEHESLLASVQEIQKMIQGLMRSLRRPSASNPPSLSSSPLHHSPRSSFGPSCPSSLNSSGGFTLVELLVSIALFSITVAIAVTGFINALHTQRQVGTLISTESNITIVLEQLAREVRTGYLFCHDPNVNNANANGSPSDNCADPVTATKCQVVDSGQAADPGTPVSDLYPSNPADLAEWDCPALNYYNGQGANVSYSLENNTLMKGDASMNGGAAQSITGGNVSVKYLHFILFGILEEDHWTPRITIAIGVAPSSTDPAVSGNVLNMQTTISARAIDCKNASSSSC